MERKLVRLIDQRRVPSMAAIVLALGLAGGACGAEEPAVQDRGIAGDWLLVEMMGNNYRGYRTRLSEPPLFRFDASGRWEGTDGCNDLFGTFTLGAEGEFEAEVVSMTDVDCDLPRDKAIPAIAALDSTAEADVDADLLELRDDSGAVIGRLTRRAP